MKWKRVEGAEEKEEVATFGLRRGSRERPGRRWKKKVDAEENNERPRGKDLHLSDAVLRASHPRINPSYPRLSTPRTKALCPGIKPSYPRISN